MGIRKRLVEAAVVDALVAFCGTRAQKSGKPLKGRDTRCPSFSDEQLWAKFAWRFGRGMLRELTLQGVAEMREHRRPAKGGDRLARSPFYIVIPQHERAMTRKETYAFLADRMGYKATAIHTVFMGLAAYAVKN